MLALMREQHLGWNCASVREFDEVLRRFVEAEIGLALTFAEMALARTDEGRSRNAQSALRGYQTAMRFLQQSFEKFPDKPIPQSLTEDIQKLRDMLTVLGVLEK